jgi:hemerythrin-like domain-containing protein
MDPSEVRDNVLRDHVALRGMLDRIEHLAGAVDAGEPWRVAELRVCAEGLLEALESHMGWEDRYLAPALRDADAWGEEREARLRRDHVEQREVLRDALERLRDTARPALLVAHNLLELVALLREDMDEEERALLGPDVLRDDVIAIDAETG